MFGVLWTDMAVTHDGPQASSTYIMWSTGMVCTLCGPQAWTAFKTCSAEWYAYMMWFALKFPHTLCGPHAWYSHIMWNAAHFIWSAGNIRAYRGLQDYKNGNKCVYRSWVRVPYMGMGTGTGTRSWVWYGYTEPRYKIRLFDNLTDIDEFNENDHLIVR